MFDGIILAAGKGERSGLLYNKILYEINNKPLFMYSLEAFIKSKYCNKVILVINQADEEAILYYLKSINSKNIELTYGGQMRQDSVANGINKCSSEVVLIHDGARPLVNVDEIEKVYEAAKTNNSSVLAVRTVDTIKELKDGKLITLNRDNLYNIQTPQGVKLDLMKNALNKAQVENFYSTDDVSLIEKYYDLSPKIVIGSYKNIKVTTSEDIDYLNYLLKEGNK